MQTWRQARLGLFKEKDDSILAEVVRLERFSLQGESQIHTAPPLLFVLGCAEGELPRWAHQVLGA